jgi:hypothetical protein
MRSAIVMLGLAAAMPAGAQAPVPEGAQFQVNTYTTINQGYPSVATDADRDLVVIWQSSGSSGTDTSGYSIQGQRFSLPTPVPPVVPASSNATRFALCAALLLLGTCFALRRRAAR